MSLNSYYNKYDKQNLAELERQKEALRELSETQKKIINENADATIKQIEEAGNANIRSAEHAYDGVINTANVQKLINERQVAERMANLGMTDSGLNRTQQTAIQLSHSNAVGEAQLARQRSIDALALEVSQKVSQTNMQRNTDLTNIDLTHQQNIYSADETYRANRDSWAAAQYKADQEAAAASAKAQIEAQEQYYKDRAVLLKELDSDDYSQGYKDMILSEFEAKYGTDEGIRNYYGTVPDYKAEAAKTAAAKVSTQKAKDRADLIAVLDNTKKSVSERLTALQNYEAKYGEDTALRNYANQMGVYDETVEETSYPYVFGANYGNLTVPERNMETTKNYYKRNENESTEQYAQRIADESYLASPRGKEFIAKYGTPENPKKSTEDIENAIYDTYISGKITQYEAQSLYRSYGIA